MIYVLCLLRLHPETDGVLKLLEVLLSSDRLAEEKKLILTNDFNIKMTQKLDEEVSVMCNVSVGILEEGFNRGIEKGIEKGKIEILANLINNMNWSLEQALSAAGLSEEEKIKYSEYFKNNEK